MWDLAFFGRQDRVSHLSTEIPLTHQRVEWWQRRMKQLIKHVSDTWPRVPIWVRKLHRVGPVGGASCESWGLRTRFRTAMPASRVLSPSTPRTAAHLAGIVSDRSVHLPADDWRHTGREDHGGQSTFSNFFTDIRIHTIREMQDQVTRDLGVPAYDFGDSWEGWQAHQDMVHPKKVRLKPPSASLSLGPGERTDVALAVMRAVPGRSGVHAGAAAPHLDGVAGTGQLATVEAETGRAGRVVPRVTRFRRSDFRAGCMVGEL